MLSEVNFQRSDRITASLWDHLATHGSPSWHWDYWDCLGSLDSPSCSDCRDLAGGHSS